MGAGRSVPAFPRPSLRGSSPRVSEHVLCEGHGLRALLLLSPQDGLPSTLLPELGWQLGGHGGKQRCSPPAWAQMPLCLVLQKRPGSPTADQASCPGARAPAPVPQPAATLREAPAALGAPGALAGAGAGAGARAKGQDRSVER